MSSSMQRIRTHWKIIFIPGDAEDEKKYYKSRDEKFPFAVPTELTP